MPCGFCTDSVNSPEWERRHAPYCGNCHQWLQKVGRIEDGEEIFICDCPADKRDLTKDPNCHNSSHEHHDPESPIVKSSQALDAEEWSNPNNSNIRAAECEIENDEHPLHSDCLLYGHVWVRVGTVKSKDVMDWGPPMCLRCRREGPEDLPLTSIDLLVQPHCETCGTPLVSTCPLCGRVADKKKEGD